MEIKDTAERRLNDILKGAPRRRPRWLIHLRRWVGLSQGVDLDKIHRGIEEDAMRRWQSPEYQATLEAPFLPGGAFYDLTVKADRERQAKEAASAGK